MATIIRTGECFPEDVAKHLSEVLGHEIKPGPVQHELCPIGWSLEGLIGGWRCGCSCHNKQENKDE